MKCGVLEWVKRNTLRWFGHFKRKQSQELVKRVYASETESPRRQGRSVVRWKDRVEEYVHERIAEEEKGLTKLGGSVWIKRGGGSSDMGNVPGQNYKIK